MIIATSADELATLQLEAAERNALWALEGALELVLVEAFDPNYATLLEAARRSLVERGGE